MKLISPREAEQLIQAGTLDVIDVREPHEYEGGHLPTARNVPLGELKANPKAGLPRDGVLLVCAAGGRSAAAAEVAEGLGLKEVFNLDGGTRAWAAQRLPLEVPALAPSTSTPRADAPEAVDPSCAMPDPGLDTVVGAHMKELRAQKGLSLDQLARATGLSRTVLGQIELGKTTASVNVVWRIAQAFEVPFSAMLTRASGPAENTVLRAAGAKRLVSPDGRYASRALYPLSHKPPAEFYELFLAAHSREDAQPHAPGTRENLIVAAGRLELKVGERQYELGKGDAIVFAADVPHAYVNPGKDECWMYLVMTYGG